MSEKDSTCLGVLGKWVELCGNISDKFCDHCAVEVEGRWVKVQSMIS
jgi:hypothetical protein